MISSVFPGEIPGRSRLALLGRRGFPLPGSVTGKADRGLVTKVNLFYNGKRVLKGEVALVDSSSPRYGEKASYYSAVCLETGEVEWMELRVTATPGHRRPF